jgi:hypothetical protein
LQPIYEQDSRPAAAQANLAPSTNAPLPGPNPTEAQVGRTRLAIASAQLVTRYTLSEGYNNISTRLVHVNINIDGLIDTYINAIRPIIEGNFRALGLRSFTDPNDVTAINSILFTIAVNAAYATTVVSYNKAVRIDSSLTTRFGAMASEPHSNYPALLSALIMSFGPYQTSTLPYKALFVPIISLESVNQKFNDNRYQAAQLVNFTQMLTRVRTIMTTDVDFKSDESTPWWMLYRVPIDRTLVSAANPELIDVFSPTEFANRSITTNLGGLVLDRTLYDLPGPCITTQLGPFPARTPPERLDDLPLYYRNQLRLNPHVPAIAFEFEEYNNVTSKADLYHFSRLFDDPDWTDELGITSDDEKDLEVDAPTKLSKADEASKPTSKRGKKKRPRISISEVTTKWTLYSVTVIYFDHKLYDRVPLSVRNITVTQANSV